MVLAKFFHLIKKALFIGEDPVIRHFGYSFIVMKGIVKTLSPDKFPDLVLGVRMVVLSLCWLLLTADSADLISQYLHCISYLYSYCNY